MSGRIIPDPLTMPVARMGRPRTMPVAETAFGAVSVVMIARAASAHPSGRATPTAASIPRRMASMSRNSPITPVEKGSTSVSATPSRDARCSQVDRASARPRAPVAALALPLLTTSARAAPMRSRARITGAAWNALDVKTPPTVLPASRRTTAKSSRSLYFTPASADPKRIPSMGSNSPIGGRFTAIRSPRSVGD